MAKKVLTHNLSEPLNGATTAKVEINTGDGNLTIDTAHRRRASAGKRHAAIPGEPGPAHPVGEHEQRPGHPHAEGERQRTTLVPFPLGGLQRSNRVADPPQPQRARPT